jgi:Tfp pilus assembly protein PilX
MRKKHNIIKQSGATLLVSLVMLLVLTIIGVSSIEDLSLQNNMTRNSQFKMQAFNTSLSESEAQIPLLFNSIVTLQNAMNASDSIEPIANANLVMPSTANPFLQTVRVIHIPVATDATDTTGFVQGGVVAGGYSLDAITKESFELNSIAELLSSGSKSNQLQGFRYTAPAG